MSKKLRLEDCLAWAETLGGKCLAETYNGIMDKMPWKCHVTEHPVWYASFNDVKNGGRWCYYCGRLSMANKQRLTLQDCIDTAATKNGFCMADEYIDTYTLMPWKCQIPEHPIWYAKFNDIRNGHWCPYCYGNAPLCLQDCYDLAASKNGLCLSTVFINVETDMLWKCHNSLHPPWEATFHNVKRGTWCPQCQHKISRPQVEIYEHAAKMFPTLEVILNDTTVLKPTRMHLDVYIPALRVGIEFDGEYYHYSAHAIANGAIQTMQRKDALCKKMDIKLMRIREQDWKTSKDSQLNRMIAFIEESNAARCD